MSVSKVTMTVEFDRPCTALLEYMNDLVSQGNSLDDVFCALGFVVGRLMAQGQPAFLQGLAAGAIVTWDEVLSKQGTGLPLSTPDEVRDAMKSSGRVVSR